LQRSAYVASEAHGKGVGEALLSALIEESEKEGFWTLQAGIFPENKSSIALHKKHGFRILGVREKLGKMGEKWRDVVLLERRSKVVGV
jgi:L-amino acid N-acyltransferase YncA